MKPILLIFIVFFTTTTLFCQAREDSVSGYKTYLTLVVVDGDREKQLVKEGGQITVKTTQGYISGAWFFKAYPDVVFIKNKKGEVIDALSLNEQETLRLTAPQSSPSRIGIGIGIGPVSVASNGRGPAYNVYNLKNNKVVIEERQETREEKIKREYLQKKKEEQLLKERRKQEKKDRKKQRKENG